MNKIFIALTGLLFITSCASKGPWASAPKADRYPASIQEYEGATDETTLRDIRSLNASLSATRDTNFNQAKKDIERRFNQILKRSAAAYSLMNDFDKELDAAVQNGTTYDLSTQRTYQKLQIARDLIESVEFRTATVYAHIWKMYLRPDQEGIPKNRVPIVQRRALELLRTTHGLATQYSSDARILGLMHLREHLEDIQEALTGQVDETNVAFAEFQQLNANLFKDDSSVFQMSYQDYIDSMKNVQDTDFDNAMKTRTPNAVSANFKTVNGNSFAAGTWVLTFDDGPHKDYTRQIASTLRNNGVTAEFFWLSKNVATYPTIAKEILDAGHGVSSHSRDHSNLAKLSGSALTAQISGSRDTITQVLREKGASNYSMKYFRAPYGSGVMSPKVERVMNAIADAGLIHIAWNVDSLDWQDKNSASVVARVVKQMRANGKGIVLFHDIHKSTANTVPLLLKDPYIVNNKIKWSRL